MNRSKGLERKTGLSQKGKGGPNPPRVEERPRNKHGRPSLEKVCEVCSQHYLAGSAAQAAARKTCSVKCAAESKRRKTAGKRKGSANPNYKGGRRAGVRDRDGERRWKEGAPNVCQNPDCKRDHNRIDRHHCVYEQHIRQAKGDRWDPRNRLMLCAGCHSSHHRGTKLELSVLPLSAIEFAVELFGPGAAYEYLNRYYAGPDPRVEALLEGAPPGPSGVPGGAPSS